MKLGFIGAGNMARAIIGGVLHSGLVEPKEVIASDVSRDAIDHVSKTLGIETTTDNYLAAQAEILFLAVKPIYLQQVLEEIKGDIPAETIIVSIVAGKDISWLEERIGSEHKIIRTMPNTPALVGEGITAVCPNEKIERKELEEVLSILQSFGKAEVVAESMMDAVVAVSGSSPAYVFMFIEAMADAAVAEGMPRAQAYQFAAQSVLGSAKMVLETGKHPGELKDMVCSPAGTTIEAVQSLENHGFRGIVMECMRACARKNREL